MNMRGLEGDDCNEVEHQGEAVESEYIKSHTKIIF